MATDFAQPAEISLVAQVESGRFENPTHVAFLPGDDDIAYVLQQNGVIWRLERLQGVFDVALFVDLRDYTGITFLPQGCHECGLYSMAFHPDFAENGFIYLSFTEGGSGSTPLESHIARFRSDDGGRSLAMLTDDMLVRDTIYQVEQPTRIHNNGQLAFGADGYLYVSFGDGGPGEDPNLNAQNLQNPFGSILRLTDEGDAAPGNLAVGGLPEIYAYGLRNPWFWSFDRETGDMWLGDVGQANIEEINIVVNGGNYGWPCYEGLRPFRDCGNDGPFVDPVWDYSHVEGQSVTGGYVYRGTDLPELYGTYVHGDFGSGAIWALRSTSNGGYERIQLLGGGRSVVAFAEDSAGELYVVDYLGGTFFKMAPAVQSELPSLPQLLSMTGCVDATNPQLPAEHLLAYDINEPFWSDNAQKTRFVALPEGEAIKVASDGNLELPVGTVLVKHFYLQERQIETRLLLNQPDTGWSGYSYRWRDDQTDAELLEGALEEPIGEQIWHYPSGAECSQCHTPAAGFSLGLETKQLNRAFTYPSGVTENQLDHWQALGLFGGDIGAHLRQVALVDSRDASQDLNKRARSYLHSNCSHCHRPRGTSQSTMDWRFEQELIFTQACEQAPLQNDLGIADARLLVPGAAEQSILWHRLATEGEHRMPAVGSNVVDESGAELIRDWIGSLTSCSSLLPDFGVPYGLQNRATGEFMVVSEEAPYGVGLILDAASQPDVNWLITPDVSFFRIRAAADENRYLHNEHNRLELGEAGMSWWSAHWIINQVGDEYVHIRNRWGANQYLHVTLGGHLRLGAVNLALEGAQWRLVPIEANP